MTLLYLLLSFLVAGLVTHMVQREFTRQNLRRRLGLVKGANRWRAVLESVEKRLSFRRQDVIDNFIRAGIYQTELAIWYVPTKLAVATALIISVWLFGDALGLTEARQQLMVTMVVLIGAVIGPDMLLQVRQRKRNRKVAGQLPYLLDLMAVCTQTGMTIEAAIAYLGQELESFDMDLAWIMRQTDARSRVVGLPTALDDLMTQFPGNEMRSFVYTLSQSLHYGSSIYDVLIGLSANIREIQILELEERVGKLSAKMSLPLILLIMFPIVILITAPGIMRMMSNGL